MSHVTKVPPPSLERLSHYSIEPCEPHTATPPCATDPTFHFPHHPPHLDQQFREPEQHTDTPASSSAESSSQLNQGRRPFSAFPSKHLNNNPLLRLPLEITEHIYKYVLGGRTVRIGHDARVYTGPPYTTLGHFLCSQDDPEESHFEFDCWEECSGPTGKQLDISILYVCRKTWTEARWVLYSTNTLSFQDDQSLAMFMGMSEDYTAPTAWNNYAPPSTQNFLALAAQNWLAPSHVYLHAVRSIRFTIDPWSYINWETTFSGMKTIIPNLRHLVIEIALDMSDVEVRKQNRSIDRLMRDREEVILLLSGLPYLTSVDLTLEAWGWIRPQEELLAWSTRVEQELLETAREARREMMG